MCASAVLINTKNLSVYKFCVDTKQQSIPKWWYLLALSFLPQHICLDALEITLQGFSAGTWKPFFVTSAVIVLLCLVSRAIYIYYLHRLKPLFLCVWREFILCERKIFFIRQILSDSTSIDLIPGLIKQVFLVIML